MLEPESIKTLFENHNVNPAGKKSISQKSLIPLSTPNTIKMITKIVIEQGTIRAFTTSNLT